MCDSSFLCGNDEKSFSEVWKLVVAVSLEMSVLASFAIQTHLNGFTESDVKQITRCVNFVKTHFKLKVAACRASRSPRHKGRSGEMSLKLRC